MEIKKTNRFWKDKRILITGANGFLGSHLSIELFKKGAFVIGIIKENPKVSYLNIALKDISNPKIKIIKSDITNFKAMLRIFKEHRPDICLHVAAQPIVGIANKSPLPTFQTNIKGTWNILEIGRICKTKALVVASSDKAYGEQKKLPYREKTALNALHPYDTSKACADMLTRCYAYTYGLNVAVTRCSNIYGPGDFNFSRIIPDTIHSCIVNKTPVIRSDGTPLRDYIFIDDVIEAYLLLTKYLYNKEIKKGEVFNFGSGKPVSVLALVNKILIIAKRHNLKPIILSKKKIHGEIDRQYLSSNKAYKILGWKYRYTLDKGLDKAYKWYKTHLNG